MNEVGEVSQSWSDEESSPWEKSVDVSSTSIDAREDNPCQAEAPGYPVEAVVQNGSHLVVILMDPGVIQSENYNTSHNHREDPKGNI